MSHARAVFSEFRSKTMQIQPASLNAVKPDTGYSPRQLPNPYRMHRTLGVVLWLAFGVVFAWRGGA